MFEFVAPRTSISFVYLLFHFDLCGVRCINISKWPQSIVSSDMAVMGTLQSCRLATGRNVRSRIECAARAVLGLGRCGCWVVRGRHMLSMVRSAVMRGVWLDEAPQLAAARSSSDVKDGPPTPAV